MQKCHLETPGGNITDGGLDIVGDPLDEVAAVLVLDAKHLLVDFLHGHSASENSSHRQISVGKEFKESQRGNNAYLPCLGSQAAIIFLASNICWVSSGTVKALYCWLPGLRGKIKGRIQNIYR